MGQFVEINQIHEAELLLKLNEIAGTMGDHRDSTDYYEKITELSKDTIEALADIVLNEL